MKKIDYYASQTPWKMPKWLGATLGGIFALIAISSGLLILQLTKSNAPAPIASVAMAPISAPAAAAAPVVKPVAPVAVATAATPTADETQQSADRPADNGRHHSKKHAAKAKKAAAVKLASAKKSKAAAPAASQAQRGTILAKHDSKDKRQDKDALDKLLGL